MIPGVAVLFRWRKNGLQRVLLLLLGLPAFHWLRLHRPLREVVLDATKHALRGE